MGMMCGLFSRAAASASRRKRFTNVSSWARCGGSNLIATVRLVDGVVRTPHLAHAAAAQQLDQAITPERRALHRLTIRSQTRH